MIKVYGLKAFAPALRGVVRDMRTIWALEELGEKYEHKIMDATKREHKQPEYLKINPFGKVPAIQDGNLTLFESSAICTYLAEKHGKLIPKAGTPDHAKYHQWVSFCVSTYEVPVARIFRNDFFLKTKDATTEEIYKEALDMANSYMQTLDGIFAKQDYLLGSEFSMADLLLASCSRFIIHTELSAKHLKFHAYLERCYSRPAFKHAYEVHG
jgi:glutathione S-transferase